MVTGKIPVNSQTVFFESIKIKSYAKIRTPWQFFAEEMRPLEIFLVDS